MAAAIEIKARRRVMNFVQCQNCNSGNSIEPLTAYIEKAREKLLFKDFQECVNTCEIGISHAQTDHFDQNGISKKIEALCILAVQAYAEMNNWQQVLPFVQQVFGSVEQCPHTVIQLCILLHAKIKEYAKCHALSSVWLRHPDNFDNDGYSNLVHVCIEHILLPQGKMNIIPQYLDSCPGLEKSDKQQILEHYTEVLQRCGLDPEKTEPSLEENVLLSNEEQKESKIGADGEKYFKDSRLTTFAKAMVARMKVYNLQTALKVAMAAVLLYLITVHGNNGDFTSTFGKVGALGSGLLKLLKSIFWPDPAVR